MTKKKILYITHRIPYPLNRGDRIRNYQILKKLAPHASIHLFSLSVEPFCKKDLEKLHELCDEVRIFSQSPARFFFAFIALCCGFSASEGAFFNFAMLRHVRRTKSLLDFDAVICSSSALRVYAQSFKGSSATIIADYIDVDSQKWSDYAKYSKGARRQLYNLEAKRVRDLEKKYSGFANAITLVSHDECDLLKDHIPYDNIYCALHGVDLNYFAKYRPTIHEVTNSCLFVGALDYRANYESLAWFVENVWKEVRQACPEAVFFIVGRGYHKSLRDFASRPGVKLIGEVSDVRPWMSSARLVVAPLQVARGIQTKVLESMAMAKPVIVSPGAARGIAAINNKHFIIAKEPKEWVQKILHCWQHPKHGTKIGKNAQDFVRLHHNWDQCFYTFRNLLALEQSSDKQPHRQNLIVLGPDYNRHTSVTQHLIEALPAGTRVLWVETIGIRSPQFSLKDIKRSLEKIGTWLFVTRRSKAASTPDHVTRVNPVMLPFYRYKWIRSFNKYTVRRAIFKQLKSLQMNNYSLVATGPNDLDFVGGLGERKSIYYIIDDFRYWPGHDTDLLQNLEQELLGKVDCVVASSDELVRLKTVPNKKSTLLTHGVDYLHFAKIRQVNNPAKTGFQICYFGLFDERSDQKLLASIAREMPEATLTIIGHVATDIRSLRAYRNIKFLGPVPYASLPESLGIYHVFILPYHLNQLSMSINPIKIKEYLATGRPVVATPLPEVAKYADYLHIAQTNQDFVGTLVNLARQESQMQRKDAKNILLGQSWQQKATEFLEICAQA